MPKIARIDRGLHTSRVILSCGHMRSLDTHPRFEPPRINQVWPCPRCTPRDPSLPTALELLQGGMTQGKA